MLTASCIKTSACMLVHPAPLQLAKLPHAHRPAPTPACASFAAGQALGPQTLGAAQAVKAQAALLVDCPNVLYTIVEEQCTKTSLNSNHTFLHQSVSTSRFLGSPCKLLLSAGIDQTRGWFYTLMVLSTALFDKPAFKSLVCNGLILAEDGKKMSKRLRNYPVSLPPPWLPVCGLSPRSMYTWLMAV